MYRVYRVYRVYIWFIGFLGFMGFMGFIGFIGFIGFKGFRGFCCNNFYAWHALPGRSFACFFFHCSAVETDPVFPRSAAANLHDLQCSKVLMISSNPQP